MSRYVVSTWAGQAEVDSFDAALNRYRIIRSGSDWPVSICNLDRCDFATDTGWDDGLTESERERLEEVENHA